MMRNQIKWTFPGRYDAILDARREKIERLLSQGNKRVLDVGCSVGVETTRLALKYTDCVFAGIDMDYGAIKIARTGIWSIARDFSNFGANFIYTRFSDFSIVEANSHAECDPSLTGLYPLFKANRIPSNLRFFLGDYEKMFFDDNSFDLAIAFNCGLYPWVTGYADNKMDIMRVLKPGGILVENNYTIVK